MKGFQFSSGSRRAIKPILETYQSGESEGYTVKSIEKDIAICDYPLLQSEFLYASKKARDQFEGEKNKQFDYSMFHFSVVKLFFDILHGISVNDITFVVALEFAILLGFDGQLKQDSVLEMELFTSALKQLMKTKMTNTENALCWLYVRSWNSFGQHVLDEDGLWNFGGEDLQTALIELVYPRKNEEKTRHEELKQLILGKFDNNMDDFCKWSRTIHSEIIENIPSAVNATQYESDLAVPNNVNDNATIVSFRATAVTTFYAPTNQNYRLPHAKWLNIDYNYGTNFDGSFFTAPIQGMYTFNVNTQKDSKTHETCISLNHNGWIIARSRRGNCGDGLSASVSLHTTIKMKKDDQISVELVGNFCNLTDKTVTFFEGRLLSKLDE